MYKASQIAEYIVSRCNEKNNPISNLQLQKILYFVQKHFIQTLPGPAFSDLIEAWQFGPVVPSVYYMFCCFGAMPITRAFDETSIDLQHQKIIDKIIEEKSVMNPWDLVDQTHKPDGAWDKAFKNGYGTIISVESIRNEH